MPSITRAARGERWESGLWQRGGGNLVAFLWVLGASAPVSECLSSAAVCR